MIHNPNQRGALKMETLQELETRLPQPSQLPSVEELRARANEVKQQVIRRNSARKIGEAAAALLSF